MHMNVVVGKDVIQLFSIKERKKWFHNQSFRYGETTYEDEDGNEMPIDDFYGDEYFKSKEDLIAFAGGESDDFSTIDNSFEVYVKRYHSFGEKDFEYWKDKAKEFPKQVRFSPSFDCDMRDFGLRESNRFLGTTVYIGEDIYFAIPEEEQDKWDSFDRYRAEDRDDEWSDDLFNDWEDLFNFWGTEHSCYACGSVYERRYQGQLTEKERKDFEDLASKKDGNQLRIY
tara:strand:- start:2065 stop:2745 length:681 start_codon:yes stop_codon:yes gene_type:complete